MTDADVVREALERLASDFRTALVYNHAAVKDIEAALAALDRLVARQAEAERALTNYADHQSWRCSYRSRYGACCCGLDETMEKLGLPPVPVEDPEGGKGE